MIFSQFITQLGWIMKNNENGLISADALASDIQRGNRCPIEIIEEVFDNIKSSDSSIFTVLLEERALKEAHASKRRWREGNPLSQWDGIPVAWKDLFDIEGRITTSGSIVLKSNLPAARDADVVFNAKQAGLISIGCLNMTEFAYSGLGLNPHYGTPKNPHGVGPARIPGGSSSGCGVAVAKGLVPLAIGSDTGGSIRIPASLNGVVGYKGSSNSFPTDGILPLSTTLDTLGPLAADVKTCIGATHILNKRPISIPKPKPINKLKFLIPNNIVFEGIQDAVLENFENSVRALESSGASIVRCAFPEFDIIKTLSEEHGYLTGPEVLDLHWNLVHSDKASHMDPRVLNRILEAKDMSARDLVVLQKMREKLIKENHLNLSSHIVLFPTTPITAPEINPLEKDDELYLKTNKLILRNTSLGNFLDWCGFAVPNGTDQDNMPTSILLSMAGGREKELFSAALSIEGIIAQNI